jgi:light-regulated signal transduction histidine kinase (bacteriophytochrome)
MRALTGFDRVTLVCGDHRAESSRGTFAAGAELDLDLPEIVTDTQAASVPIFPREEADTSAADALLRSPAAEVLNVLASAGVRAAMRVPFDVDDLHGEFRCEHRTPREPSFELHAAAELFAQLFAMRLEIDHLKNGN